MEPSSATSKPGIANTIISWFAKKIECLWMQLVFLDNINFSCICISPHQLGKSYYTFLNPRVTYKVIKKNTKHIWYDAMQT